MFLSNLSIKQPVFTTMVMLGLVVLGAFGYRRLNVDQFPDVDLPIVTVQTTWKGAGAESVESEVTKRIEEAVHTVAGVKEVRSTSSEGLSSVVIQFNLDRNGRDATNDVRDKVAALATVLPTDADAPLIQRFDPASQPIASLGISSKTMSTRELTDLADRVVKRQLVNVEGVGSVNIVGGARREIHIALRPDDLRARGVTAATVVQRLGPGERRRARRARGSRPQGGVVRVAAKIHSAADFGTLTVGSGPDGAAVYLRDVADVQDAQEELRSLALVGTERTVTLDLQKQSGANTVAVVHEVQRRLPELQHDLGGDVKVEIVQSNAKQIEESVNDVMLTLILGALLTILVVYVFLNSWRSTIITGLTLPVSVIGAFLMVWIMGFTLNMLTLMALSLAIGLLIDDAIVVRENIVRHADMGKSHEDAARDGTSEIGTAVLSTTLAIVAVFVPVAFMKGIIGRFFFQFGITVAFAVLISLFVSFTLDPMLSSVWPDPHGKRGPIGRTLERFSKWFDRLSTRYHRVIMWCLTHRKSTMGIAFATFVVTIMLAGKVSAGFMPDYDKGEFQVDFRTPVGSSLDYTESRAREIIAVLSADPDVDFVFTRIGTGTTAAVNEGSVYVRDKVKGRKRSTARIRSDLRVKLAEIPDVRIAMEDVGGAGGGGQQPIQISVRGPDLNVLDQRAHALLDSIHDVKGLADAQISQERTKPELRVVMDRIKASDQQVTAQAVGSTIQTLVGGQVATQIRRRARASATTCACSSARRFACQQGGPVRAGGALGQAEPERRATLVALDQVAHVDDALGPSRHRAARARAAGHDRRRLRGALARRRHEAGQQEGGRHAPLDGYSVSEGGQTRDMVESAGYALESLILAIIFIYLVLASQFESFLQPLSIMMSLPLSMIGVFFAMIATGDTLNIMTIIGFIMLMGLVTKNGILLIDNANHRRREGMPRADAIARAGEIRLRPIIMTTLAMIFGMVPLALEIGEGAGFRAPMARAVIGGLISSTFLTLIVVPVVYTYLDDFGSWFQRKLFPVAHP